MSRIPIVKPKSDSMVLKVKPFTTRKSDIPFDRAPVDIIIPFHGQYDKVSRLIESIFRVTRSNPYQITLVDDGSPNAEFVSSLQNLPNLSVRGSLPQLQCLRLHKQQGFGAALWHGYKNSKQPYVCFVHSDCVVEDANWLRGMGMTLVQLSSSQGVRLVSARSNNPGGIYDSRLKSEKEARGANVILTEGFLPLYCAMATRDLFTMIKGFIKPYPFAMYEDEELAFRMKKYGFKQAISGNSWIYHEGEATIKQLLRDNPDAQQVMESNRERCLADMRSLAKPSSSPNPFKNMKL